jgi:hypothetical protein
VARRADRSNHFCPALGGGVRWIGLIYTLTNIQAAEERSTAEAPADAAPAAEPQPRSERRADAAGAPAEQEHAPQKPPALVEHAPRMNVPDSNQEEAGPEQAPLSRASSTGDYDPAQAADTAGAGAADPEAAGAEVQAAALAQQGCVAVSDAPIHREDSAASATGPQPHLPASGASVAQQPRASPDKHLAEQAIAGLVEAGSGSQAALAVAAPEHVPALDSLLLGEAQPCAGPPGGVQTLPEEAAGEGGREGLTEVRQSEGTGAQFADLGREAELHAQEQGKEGEPRREQEQGHEEEQQQEGQERMLHDEQDARCGGSGVPLHSGRAPAAADSAAACLQDEEDQVAASELRTDAMAYGIGAGGYAPPPQQHQLHQHHHRHQARSQGATSAPVTLARDGSPLQ